MIFSKYKTHKEKDNITINFEQYVKEVKNGDHQKTVFDARANKEDKKKYTDIKGKLPAITGSCVMKQNGRSVSNIDSMNGLILLDIDEDVDNNLRKQIEEDIYTFSCNRSVSGTGLVVFVKINPNKFLESFYDLAQYYWDKFNLAVDQSCKDKSRLRYISYDVDIFVNENSKKFIAKTKIKKEKKKESFVFAKNDFTDILEKVKDIDLCQDDYKRYCDIGFAIGSQFGINGLDYFKAICQSGAKYDPKSIEKHYKNFCKDGGISIATFYHYVKEAGIEIYSEQTKATIKTVNVQKVQGLATVESVANSLKIQKIEIDEDLIKKLIESKEVFTIQEDISNMAKLENFIVENYAPERNIITNEIKIDGIVIDDHKLNSIYKTACKVLDFNVAKSDVRDIINSDTTKDFNPLNYFFSVKEYNEGQIEAYIDCIQPNNEYNRWAFKKWLIGSVHNWISPLAETKVSPLTLVLCGQKQGTGKTSFFRNLLPEDLQDYLIEKKIDANDKDSMYNLAKGLICFDDEFGGLATKDVKDFKRVADTNWIDIRLPYSAFYSKIKRRASLCGTTNEANILKDVTGNRRLLPINVESIDYEKMIKIDTNSLWREAYKLWREDFDWKIYKAEDIEFLNEHTTKNMDVNPIEELFFTHFSLEETSEHTQKVVMNQGEILNYLNANCAANVTKYDVKDIFTKNKFSYKSYRFNGKVKLGILLFKFEQNQSLIEDDVPY